MFLILSTKSATIIHRNPSQVNTLIWVSEIPWSPYMAYLCRNHWIRGCKSTKTTSHTLELRLSAARSIRASAKPSYGWQTFDLKGSGAHEPCQLSGCVSSPRLGFSTNLSNKSLWTFVASYGIAYHLARLRVNHCKRCCQLFGFFSGSFRRKLSAPYKL